MLGLIVALLVGASGDSCVLPVSFLNYTSNTPADLKFTLAVDEFVYSESDTINFYYIVENVGTDTVTVFEPQTPQFCFAVYPDTCYSLDQPGCFDAAPFFHPTVVWLMWTSFTLVPGECEVFSLRWDQRPWTWVDPAPGSYRVFGGLWITTNDWPSSFKLNSGLSVEILIEEIPTGIQSVEQTTWGHIKSLYR